MGNIKTRGIVIKQTNYGEADRMLTIFTSEFGIIKAAARGVRRIKNRQSAAAQFLCYSDFELYKNNSDITTINSMTSIESFYPISEDIVKLALFTYLSDITFEALQYSNPDERVLNLFLNTLHLCAYKNINLCKAKAVYEIRFMSYIGFAPVITVCSSCGSSANLNYFDSCAGGVICDSCYSPVRNCFHMSADVYHAIYYILYCVDKKVFSFNASNEVLVALNRISESYTKTHLDKEFISLDYFKKILT